MNRIDFSHAGGFPLDTDTLQFLQKSYSDPIKALTKLGGNNYIISGVIDDGIQASDGWVVIDGEIMPFKGDLKQSTIMVVENIETANFENGGEREVFFTRYATFGVSLQSIPFSSLARMSDLQQQQKRADDLRADHEEHKEHVTKRTGELQAAHEKRAAELQTAHETYKSDTTKKASELQAAHDGLKLRVDQLEKSQFVRGMIMAWSGSIRSIPSGWQLCTHLADKFILGAGGSYRVGAVGGEREHKLTKDEMPEHYHVQGSESLFSFYGGGHYAGYRNWGSYHVPDTCQTYQKQHTSTEGDSAPHNNMPPYYALAYIEYVGY